MLPAFRTLPPVQTGNVQCASCRREVAIVDDRSSQRYELLVQRNEPFTKPCSRLYQRGKHDRALRAFSALNLLREPVRRSPPIYDEHPFEQHVEELEG